MSLTTGKRQADTGFCRHSRQCHTINIYVQCRLFSWDEECKLFRKNKEENTDFDKMLFRFSYGIAERMETRGYWHILVSWEHINKMHYIQECCLVCKPENYLLLAHPAAKLARGRAALSTRDLWKHNSGSPMCYTYTRQAVCTPFSSLTNSAALHNGNPTATQC